MTKRKRTNEAKKKTEQERQNLLRNWISEFKLPRPEEYEHFLTDEGKRDLLDLNWREVFTLWDYLILYGGSRVPPDRVLRSCLERLLRVVSYKSFGQNDLCLFKRLFRRFMSNRYFTSNFPDLVSEMIKKAPRKVFFNETSRTEWKNGKNNNEHSHVRYSTLLHKAAGEIFPLVPLWVLKETYDAYPRAISQQDNKGNLPFHAAMNICDDKTVVTNEDLERASFLFSKYPSAAGVMETGSCIFPLHQLYRIWNRVVIYNDSQHMVDTIANLAQQFLEVCPMAANDEMPNRGGMPLFFVCRRSDKVNASKMIIDLIKHHPDGIFYRHRKVIRGFTPLQLLCKDASADLLNELQQPISDDNNHRNGILARRLLNARDDRNGNTVLHVLFKMNHDVKAYKRALGEEPWNNVHLRHGLVPIFPQLTMVRNEQGDIPLHVRLKFGPPIGLLEDVQVLVNQGEPNTAVTLTFNELYPFMLVASKPRQEQCLSTTFFLLRRSIVLRGGLQNF